MADIVVVGSINIDIVALTDRYPGHGDTVFGKKIELLPGGKGANQATACARLGKTVHMVGAIGKDLYGEIVLNSLQKNKVDTTYVKRIEDSPTGCAIIAIDRTTENTILVVKGANDQLQVADVCDAFSGISNSQVLLVQMEVPEEVVIQSMIEAKKKDMFVILDPAPADGITVRALEYADLIIPNRQETKELTGIDVVSVDTAYEAAKCFELMGVKKLIIKMADKGSLVCNDGKYEYIDAVPVTPIDTVGAGDSYAGALACAIVDGEDLVSAAQFATIVGALKVMRLGAQVGIPTIEEVDEFCKERNLMYYKLKKENNQEEGELLT
ncbi:ribokinase [Geobacillus thermocatenulatus]|uniref:ribokinase n=1 Tax=Geobacillus thermocatenulatus TaxID=33938 RepID=UPI000473AAB2|nr:ribokinase [Geobacillus thermocatenulatus]